MSNGIDFVIGGTDKASPKMAAVRGSMARLESGVNRLRVATQALTAAMAPLLAIYAAVRTVQRFGETIGDANAAYDKQADAVRGLNKALELQGANVAEQSAKLQTFAGDMQKLTGVGDEATLALMRQASMMGVQADQLDQVAKASVGLSEVLGKDLRTSMNLLRKAQEGNFEQFERQFPQMKAMTTEAEKLAFVTDLATKGLDAKAAASNTVSGSAERASGAMGDLMEMVGALIAPVRVLINTGIKALAESLQQVLAPAAAYAQKVLENIGPIMDWVKAKVVQAVNGIVAAFTFVEVIVTNLGSVWEMMRANAELRFEQMKNNIMHVLTKVIPQYAAWFSENFVNLLRDGMNLAVTVVTNHIRKIIDTFAALWDFIASRGQSDILGRLGEIAGRSYLEGFESSLTSLPEIATRQLSQKEKDLADKVGAIGANLGYQFAKKFSERMVRLDDNLSDAFDKEIDLKINQKIDEKVGGGIGLPTALSATETRLLTRGPESKQQELLERAVRGIQDMIRPTKDAAAAAMDSASTLAEIEENTRRKTRLVPTP